MNARIDGISAERLEPVIAEALAGFTAVTGGQVTFDPKATELHQAHAGSLLTSRPTEVMHVGETVASLTVMALNPYYGSGHRSNRTISSIPTGFHMSGMKVVPRNTEGAQAIHGDVHLALASFKGSFRGFEPRLFAGSLSLFGLAPDDIDAEAFELGYLGQNNLRFSRAISGQETPAPTASITVAPTRLDLFTPSAQVQHWSEDLRAIHNRYPGVTQIAAFMTLHRDAHGEISSRQADTLRLLNVTEPVPGTVS